jgi:hypothetical protein
MADTTTRKFDLIVGTSYNGSGLKSATADMAKLRKELALPAMGPLGRDDQLSLSMAQHSIRRVQLQRERNDIYRLDAIKRPDFDFSDLQGQGVDITRLRGGQGPRTLSEMKGDQQERSLAQQAEHLGKMLKLFGGIELANRIGNGLQKLPELEDKFARDIQNGATKTEAFASGLADLLPGIGPLAKGFRNLGDFIHDLRHPAEADARRKREDDQDARDARQAQQDKRDANRQAIGLEGRDVGLDAYARSRLLGVRGNARDREQAQIDYDKEVRRLDELLGKKGSLSPEGQKALEAQVAAGKATAAGELNDKVTELERQFQAKVEASRREHVDRLNSIDTEAKQAELERDGKFFTSKLGAIGDAAKVEQTEAIRRYRDALNDPDQDPSIAAARMDKEIAASRMKASASRTKEKDFENRAVEDAEDDHKQRLLDSDANYVSRRLVMAGKDREAEKLAIKQQFQDRLHAIDDNLTKSLRDHAERAPELKRQAAEDAGDAARIFGLDNEESDRRRLFRFRGALPAGISGESHLLSGQAGAGGTQSELLDPAIRSAKAAEESRNYLKRLTESTEKLVVALAGKSDPKIIK